MTERLVEMLGWWLALWAVASVLSALTYPLLCRAVAGLRPAVRASARLAYACMAPMSALLALVLVTTPALAGFLMPAHCHGSQCGVHAPVYPADSVVIAGLAAACSLAALLLVALLLWALRRGRRQWRVLSAFTRSSPVGYRMLESDRPLAFCVGLMRPQILLSRGLIEQLQPDELTVVLAHERAHVKRQDNLRALLLRWSSLLWPAGLARRLRADMGADAEQACDLEAVRAGAGAGQVARVIRKLAGVPPGPDTTAVSRGVAFGCRDTTARLAALESGRQFDDRSCRIWFGPGLWLAANWCVQVYLLAASSHWLVEWLGSAVT